VEHKQAPEKIMTSNSGENPGIGAANQILEAASDQPKRTRPLCPYPQNAQYVGQGSTDDASNFVCKAPSN
jgi:feruloyl esterase